MAIKIILLVVFFAVMVGIGIYCRRHATNVNGFVLGGRNVGPWLTAFAFGTSYFSAVIFIGYAGQFGWNFGLASTWIGLGNAFIGSLLAWVVLGRRTRIMTQHLDSKTMPDFFDKRYNSTALKIAASVIVFIFLIPYTASLYNGLSSLFNMAFNIPYYVCIIVMAVLTCVYVLVGGYMATALNDFIQGIIMLGGIMAVIIAVLNSNGGLMEAMTNLSYVEDASTEMSGAFTAFFGPDPLALLFVVILTSLGTWGLPQMVGKFYAIKSEDAIKKGTIISTVFAIIVAGGCYFLGGFGRLYSDAEGIFTSSGSVSYDSIIPTMLGTLEGTTGGEIIIAVVIVLVLAASMSTLSSLVLTSSSTLTLDVIDNKKQMSEKKKLLVMRIFVAFFVLLSAIIAIVKDKYGFTFIAQMMGVSWGALAGAFLAPFLYGLYYKRTTKASVWVCFGFAIVVTCVQLLCSFGVISFSGTVMSYLFASSIRSGVVSMVGGLILVPIVSAITPKLKKESVDKMFECYDKKVTVSVKDTLED
ncbi:MAG: sodium:solute symporter [Clostridiales bacterium]|nr:sodium:solute symporter [Clostridiales bacterium]